MLIRGMYVKAWEPRLVSRLPGRRHASVASRASLGDWVLQMTAESPPVRSPIRLPCGPCRRLGFSWNKALRLGDSTQMGHRVHAFAVTLLDLPMSDLGPQRRVIQGIWHSSPSLGIHGNLLRWSTAWVGLILISCAPARQAGVRSKEQHFKHHRSLRFVTAVPSERPPHRSR